MPRTREGEGRQEEAAGTHRSPIPDLSPPRQPIHRQRSTPVLPKRPQMPGASGDRAPPSTRILRSLRHWLATRSIRDL